MEIIALLTWSKQIIPIAKVQYIFDISAFVFKKIQSQLQFYLFILNITTILNLLKSPTHHF